MISLTQIQLLEEKVESAVAKILQLTEEKQALSQRCLQLEEENKRLQDNISSFEQDQQRIEQGIIKALDRLNTVENSVLQAISVHQEISGFSNDGGMNPKVEDTSSQHFQHIENGISHNQPPVQISVQHSEDIGLVPMFSEEIVAEREEIYGDNLHGAPSSPDLQDEMLLDEKENQEDYDSGQLDIF